MGYLLSLKYAHKLLVDNIELFNIIPIRFHSKIHQITYGGDHLPQSDSYQTNTVHSYALAIARAEPENNLDIILNAFCRKESPKLIVIANWRQTRYGRILLKKYAHHQNISLIDPIYDQSELQKYRTNCSIYIHGHSVGGTNPSLVEAMYAGVPVFAWDNEFNRITTNNLACYFSTENDLLQLINNYNPVILSEQALQLQHYARIYYKWTLAAEQLKRILL
jgi:glycosyltransferase involved in cell wall biosynthesis